MAGQKQGLVFVSCGQFSDAEVKLGQDLAGAVNDLTDFEGYFAQNQSSLDGLSTNILGALNRCCGFVGVMHYRGKVQTPDGEHLRGSVWVEQEIAIAAFLRQALDRELPVVVYIQKGIKREGIRDQLLLGAIDFATEQEVLNDFRSRLSHRRFIPMRLIPPKDVSLEFKYRRATRLGSGERYQLSIEVQNIGSEPLKDYWVNLTFPKAAMENGTIAGEQKARNTGTHRYFRFTEREMMRAIYPGDRIDFFAIEYYIPQDLQDQTAFVIAECGSSGMRSRRIERPLRQLQES